MARIGSGPGKDAQESKYPFGQVSDLNVGRIWFVPRPLWDPVFCNK